MNSSIFNSKKLPIGFLTALILIILTIIIGGFYAGMKNILPAPMFTERISLDEKIRHMRIRNPIKADYAVLGSSVALNSISSNVMLNKPEFHNNYYNFSAWHLMISNLPNYWDFIHEVYNPKVVIIVVSVYDFRFPWKEFSFDAPYIKGYIDGGPVFPYYIKNHKAGFLRRIWELKDRRMRNDSMASLNFDEGGGVLVDLEEENRKKKKLVLLDVVPENLKEKSYIMLDQWFRKLEEENVHAIIVQAPIRDISTDYGERFRFLKQHWARIDEISKKHGMHFLNMHELTSIDKDLFADASHLMREGANLFTKALVEEIEKRSLLE